MRVTTSGRSGPVSDPRIKLLFTPEQLKAMNRCMRCGWHPKTQGHHPECAEGNGEQLA